MSLEKNQIKDMLIVIQTRIDACNNLLTYLGVTSIPEINSEKDNLLTLRDSKIAEYNAL